MSDLTNGSFGTARPGSVVTFYSYKGGVGRSFTLANIALLLARWGYRVLCVDWDLEAPGLHDYFRPVMETGPRGGVVDLVDDFLSGRDEPVEHTVRLTGVGALDFLPAGAQTEDYVRRVQEIDWEQLYRAGFGGYLERCRERWTADHDFVLIDSRTGISDIGGICTAHLPDHLVVVFTANMQSIQGAVDIAGRANIARDRLPYDRPQLTVLPVLSRFDSREEYDRSEEWRRICLNETKVLFRNWLDLGVPPAVMSRHLTLPYVSYWSFGEQLPVRSESSPAADQISFALETVAAVIAHRLDRTELLAENRDAYVAAVRASRREFEFDVRISTPRSAWEFAIELSDELTKLGVRWVRSFSGDESLLARAEDNARHLCLLVDVKVSRWQAAEADLFLHRSLGQDRRLIPVIRDELALVPGYLSNLRYVLAGPSATAAEVARGIADEINGVADADVVGLLRRAERARLRPPFWGFVNEIVTELIPALEAGDEAHVRELAEDLAVAVRPRAIRGDDDRVPPPDTIRKLIKTALAAAPPD